MPGGTGCLSANAYFRAKNFLSEKAAESGPSEEGQDGSEMFQLVDRKGKNCFLAFFCPVFSGRVARKNRYDHYFFRLIKSGIPA